jgi:hypothetical protein
VGRRSKDLSPRKAQKGERPRTEKRSSFNGIRPEIFRLAFLKGVCYKKIMEEIRHLYLKVGDWVVHPRYPEWGSGLVIEERNSSVQGGSSYVKVAFRDGQTRIFDNNFKNATCCYHAGLRRR